MDSWLAESLPASVTQPSALATDGTTLWAAGLGVAKKTGAAWTALPSPGGKVLSAAVWSGDLVAGQRGNVARYTGSAVSFLSSGMPVTANVQALASIGGMLWAGTDQTLYSWNGSAWIAEAGFGFHDVRAITSAGGVLRAATADAGVFAKSGTWAADNSGILSPGALSFAAAGADVYVGTAGAPVYRRLGAGWVEAGMGLWAATISDVATIGGVPFVSSRGAGLAPVASTPGGAIGGRLRRRDVPCRSRDGRAARITPRRAAFLAASNCNVSMFTMVGGSITATVPAASGLPAGVLPAKLARVVRRERGRRHAERRDVALRRVVVVGRQRRTLGNGVDPRRAAGRRRPSTRPRAPPSSRASRAAGWARRARPRSSRRSAATRRHSSRRPATGISAATLGGSLPAAWRSDDVGANTAFVSSLDTGNGVAFAAGGSAGVLRKKDGGWQPENAGLAAGADARVVRASGDEALRGNRRQRALRRRHGRLRRRSFRSSST